MVSDKHIIEQYMHECLIENDNLLVPELGQFDTQYKGTFIQPGVNMFFPPNKSVVFYPSAKYDDGIFSNYVAEREGTTVEDAKERIKQYVRQVKIDVGIERKYAIDAFGNFTLNPQDVLEFHPDENANFYGDSYGLNRLLGYKPIERESQVIEEEEEEPPIFPIQPEEEYVEEKKSFPWRRFAAIAAGVGIIGLGFYGGYAAFNAGWFDFSSTDDIADNTDLNEDENLTDNNPPDTIPEERDEFLDSLDESIAEDDEVLAQEGEVYEPPNITNPNFGNNFRYNPTPPANLSQVMISKKSNRHFVIVGSFDKIENAYSYYNNMIALGIKTTKIVEPLSGESKYRVSYLDEGSKKAAKEQGRNLGIKHWVLSY